MCGMKPCDSWLCSYGENFRRLTEARTVARWPKAEREGFYKLVSKHRGEPAARQLVEDIKAVWGSV